MLNRLFYFWFLFFACFSLNGSIPGGTIIKKDLNGNEIVINELRTRDCILSVDISERIFFEGQVFVVVVDRSFKKTLLKIWLKNAGKGDKCFFIVGEDQLFYVKRFSQENEDEPWRWISAAELEINDDLLMGYQNDCFCVLKIEKCDISVGNGYYFDVCLPYDQPFYIKSQFPCNFWLLTRCKI